MTNKVIKTKLRDSARAAIFHFYLESDGIAGELSNYTLIDPVTDFAVPLTADNHLTITQLWYSQLGFDAVLKFDALEDLFVWAIPRAADNNHVDFRYFGGIKDRTTADSTGKLVMSTVDFAQAGRSGVLIIEVNKD